MKPKLKNVEMWVVGVQHGRSEFTPVAGTAAHARRDAIGRFMANTYAGEAWAQYRYPKGCYEVFKFKVANLSSR